jgi:hypothetical protein
MATPDENSRIANLIGLPIPEWALKQIKTRSNKNSLDTRSNGLDNSNIIYLANKTGWIKLVSSININSQDISQRLRSIYHIEETNSFMLAKQFILFGGTLAYDKNKDNYSLRSGLDSYNVLGKDEISYYGYKPMPGITGVTIKTLGKLGSFRQAEVKFRASDKYQLDILDILYLRLGYTMFLEWGQTFYYKDGNDTLHKSEDVSINPFEVALDKDTLRRKIASKIRETEGNYDAMLGMVTNFNFTMTQDGGYDCSITLTSIGILGDATRINVFANLTANLNKELSQLVNSINKLIENKAQKDFEKLQRETAQAIKDSQPFKPVDKLDSYPPCVKSTFGTSPIELTDKEYPKRLLKVNDQDRNVYTYAMIGTVNGIEYLFYLDQNNDNSGKLQTADKLGTTGTYECKGLQLLIQIGNNPLIQSTEGTFADIIGKYIPYDVRKTGDLSENPLSRTIGSGNISVNTKGKQVYWIPNSKTDLDIYSKTAPDGKYYDKNYFASDPLIKQPYIAFEFNKSFIPIESIELPDIQQGFLKAAITMFTPIDNGGKYKVNAKLNINYLNSLPAFNPEINAKNTNFNAQLTANNTATSTLLPGLNPTGTSKVDVIDILTSRDTYKSSLNKIVFVNNDVKNKSFYESSVFVADNKNNQYAAKTQNKINLTYEYTFDDGKRVYFISLTHPADTDNILNREVEKDKIPYILDEVAISTDNDLVRNQIRTALSSTELEWSVASINPKTFTFELFTVIEVIKNVKATNSGNNLTTIVSDVLYSLPILITTNDPSIITSIAADTDVTLRKPTDFVNPTGTSQNTTPTIGSIANVAQPEKPITLDVKVVQEENALKFRSAIEIMLRIVQINTYEQAVIKNGEQIISGDLKKNHVEGPQTPSTRLLYTKLFSDGIFSNFFNRLLDNNIKPSYKEYTSATQLDRFMYDSAYGFHRGLLSNKAQIPENPDEKKKFEDQYLVKYSELMQTYLIPFIQSQNLIEGSGLNYPVYIPLGFFIMMLNHIGTLYVNDRIEGEKPSIRTDIPLYYIDFNPESNMCLSSPIQFTADPYKFLIPMQGTTAEYKKMFPSNIDTKDFWDRDKTGDTISGIIPKFRTSNKSGDSAEISSFRGKTMNVLVSIDYLLQIINVHTAKDSSNSVYLKPMLEEVISDMNKSLGNYNMLRVGFDDAADCFFIADDQLIPDSGMIQKDKSSDFNIPLLGKKSIAKSFDIKTEVSSKLANVLAISANSDAGSQANGGTDGSDYGIYNLNYFDRYKKIVTSINDADISGSFVKADAAAQKAASLFDSSIRTYYTVGASKDSTSENMIGNTVNYYIELMAKVKNKNEGTRASSVIPISLNLSMDGMSGLNIGQAFTVDDALIPYRYTAITEGKPNKVGFIILGVDHEFSANVWTTSIRTGMYYVKNTSDYKGAINTTEKILPQSQAQISSDTNTFIDKTPWSAAFISYVMSNAGFTSFPVSAAHVNYLNGLKNNQDFQMLDPNDTKVQMQVGDLVAYNRNNNTNTYNTSPWRGESHVNIVVDVVGTKVNVIGGNVSQRVAYDNSYENGKSKPNVFVIVRPINIDKAKKAADIAKQQRNSWLKLTETQLDAQVFLRDYYRTVNLTLP